MSLKLIRIGSRASSCVLIAAAVAAIAMLWFFAKWNFANAVSMRTDDSRISALAAELSPDDPQTHFANAVLHEKTFEPDDMPIALSEYERAVALSPNNYLIWLALGGARDRSGDPDGAEAAYAKARSLAPNYADVNWAFGNTLLRKGDTERAFSFLRDALAARPTYAGPAVSIAMQISGNDPENVRQALGDTPAVNAALAVQLMQQKRLEDASAAWERIAPDDKGRDDRPAGLALAAECLAAHEYRLAARIYGEVGDEPRPAPGVVTDGGFENGVKTKNAGPFDWQIGDGSEPQISLSSSQHHGGNHSLWITFDTARATDFRQISQTVAVDPGVSYEFSGYYRADLRGDLTVRWEIVRADGTTVIAKTLPAAPNADWTPRTVDFTAPVDTDAIAIRLVRDDCPSPICPLSGKIWFDDVSIRRL